MKSLGVTICALISASLVSVAPAAAQYSMRTGSLGGSNSARASSRPLGGFGPGYNALNRYSSNTYRGPLYGYPYAYSVWVPDYYDYLNYQSQYTGPYPMPADPYAPPPAAGAPQQPVIINQYFGGPPPAQMNTQQGYAPGYSSDNGSASVQGTGGTVAPTQNYYLIAYKNHEVYSALAYWVEDKTLHYVTTQNTHNQAALNLIDVELTKKLNQRNDVPFSIPGE